MNPLEQYKPDFSLEISDYEPFIGAERINHIKKLAEPVHGKGWANINSTLSGGGVAEMLQRVVPLARSLDIDATWHVIRGNDKFFGVTKKFHNLLQGVDQPINLEELYNIYMPVVEENGKNTFIVSDMIVVHDPQPAALIGAGRLFGNLIWRCHIDTSDPNPILWRFMLPFINQYKGAVFTTPSFVGPGLHIPVYQIYPCIDPMAKKNHHYTRQEALDILQPLFVKNDIDPEKPIIAAVSRYDMHKNQINIIRAFKKMRKIKTFYPAPYLIFIGNTASDDPEGGAMLDLLQREAGDDPNIRFFVNVEDNDRIIGSLMSVASAFVHISTKEGFGLVVSEALWQGTPVIGSNVGGITAQVINGKNGFIVDPLDVDKVAEYLIKYLEDDDLRKNMGKQAREHVRANFLMPELIRRYIMLMRFNTGIDSDYPDFRLDDISYAEVLNSMMNRKYFNFSDIPKR